MSNGWRWCTSQPHTGLSPQFQIIGGEVLGDGGGGVGIVFSDINFITILTSVNIADIMNVNIC